MGWSLNTRRKGKERLVKQKGFTLIELMIVVAIIGILAAIAMPQYNKYVARTQVAEAFTLLGPVKQALTLYYQETGKFPGSPEHTTLADRHDALGIPRRDDWSSNSDYIWRLVVYDSGIIRIVFKRDDEGVSSLIARKRFELKPKVDPTSGAITSWSCFTNTSSTVWIDEAYIQSCN